MLEELREPLREDTGKDSALIFPAPVRLRNTTLYRDAEKLISARVDPEAVLLFLRESGMDERDSMYSVAGLMGLSIREAKALIYNSQAWSGVRSRDEKFREIAEAALRDSEWKADD